MNAVLRRLLVRCVIIIVWLGIVLSFLLLPRFLQRFYTDDSRSINLYVAPMMIDAKKLTDFQQETGIKVYMHYYESNEELLQKLYVTGGKGYDLVVPVDYSVDLLRTKGLIQKIDHTKLLFWHRLLPALLHHYYDSDNAYSVPYFLNVYGLGIDTDYFGDKQPLASWKLLFEPQGYDVAITDVARRAITIAGYYLYGRTENLANAEQRAAIERLLIKQKEWVTMYTDIRGEGLLATKNCPVVMTIASDLWMVQREYPHLVFKVPHEGTFVTVDSFVIPTASTKQDLVYAFLNYMYRPEVIEYHTKRYGFCPPVNDVAIEGTGIFCPTQEQMSTFNFFRNNDIPESVINDMWIWVMSH